MRQMSIFEVQTSESEKEFEVEQLKAAVASDIRRLQALVGEVEAKAWVEAVS